MNPRQWLPAWPLGLTLLGTVLVTGCSSKPQAPELRNDPVYQNDREGFRFLVPEGWAQVGNTNGPPGPVKKNRMLVQYRRKASGEHRAMLEVDMVDLPPATDLATYLAESSFGVKQWQQTGSVEAVSSNGLAGERYTFTGRVAGKQEMTKEVVVFRRGALLFFHRPLSSARYL
jgi:hypothetical protein